MTCDNHIIAIPEKPQALSRIYSRSLAVLATVVALLVAPQAVQAQCSETESFGPRDLSDWELLGEVGSNLSSNFTNGNPGPIRVEDPFDFSGAADCAEVTFHEGSLWLLTSPNSADGDFIAPNSVFSGGDDVVSIAAHAMLMAPYDGSGNALPPEQDRYVVDFGGGDDVLHNAGTVAIGTRDTSDRRSNSGEMRFENLETFNNAGVIRLGAEVATGTIGIPFLAGTDSWPDDILSTPGANFHGVVDGAGRALGRVIMDVDMNAVGQTGCGAEFRFADGSVSGNGNENLRLPVADCIDLRDGYASGRTLLVINQLLPGDRGAYNPEGSVLVDVSGDSADQTDPDAFGIAPESHQYSPIMGGVIDKGLFLYTLSYDSNDHQYKLYGLPSTGTQQMPLLGHMANQLWRTSTDAWFDRRVNQRDIDRSDRGGSFWFRATRSDGDRDVTTPIAAGAEVLNFDNSYQQDDTTATIGTDFIARSDGNSAWVFGGMLGYGRSDIAFDDSRNSIELRGMHAGLYGSFVLDAFYVDLAVNQAWLDLDYDVPALQLFPETALVRTEVESLGGQIETGWRWRTGRVSVEPLIGYTHVTADMEDISIPADDPLRFGGEVTLGDPTSSRGSLGLRLRMDNVLPNVVPTSIGLTAKAIEEFDGESDITVTNVGPQDARQSNTFDGTFSQVTGDVSITNAAKTVAGFLKLDGMFHDDYESVGVSLGLRAQW